MGKAKRRRRRAKRRGRRFTSVLIQDVAAANKRVEDADSPTHRRELVRSVFAAIEGLNWDLKRGLYGRGFNERTHVHTLMYMHGWTRYRDADPIPLELSLDHAFLGMATVAIERREGVDRETFDAWWRDRYLDGFLAGSPIASCSRWVPVPQREGPMAIPRVERTHLLDMHLFFLDDAPQGSWDRFRTLGRDVDASGLGRVTFASPWWPTDVGTDRYTDALW